MEFDAIRLVRIKPGCDFIKIFFYPMWISFKNCDPGHHKKLL